MIFRLEKEDFSIFSIQPPMKAIQIITPKKLHIPLWLDCKTLWLKEIVLTLPSKKWWPLEKARSWQYNLLIIRIHNNLRKLILKTLLIRTSTKRMSLRRSIQSINLISIWIQATRSSFRSEKESRKQRNISISPLINKSEAHPNQNQNYKPVKCQFFQKKLAKIESSIWSKNRL